jgi:hypothetical protein
MQTSTRFSRRAAMLSLLSAALVAACGPVDSPASGLTVTASISAVALADNCPTPTGAGAARADCAAFSDAGTGLVPTCGSICRQSSVQIALTAGAGTTTARIAVMNVRLLDAATGAPLETLTAREPQRWSDATSAYLTWDEGLVHDTSLRVMYKLSAPTWTSLGSATDRLAYTRRYRLEVVITVDGIARTLRSEEITREPEIVT